MFNIPPEIYLILYYLLSHVVSFLCSLLEAALLSCTPSFVSSFAIINPKKGDSLKKLKTNINEPLAAILTFNTAAHTIGASGVGAMVEVLYGDAYLTIASIILTLTMLYISEMIPKTIGSIYWRNIISHCIPVIEVMIKISYPFVYSFKSVAKLLGAEDVFIKVHEDEVRALIEEGVSFGVFQELEKKIVFRVFNIADRKAKEFMVNRKDADWIDVNISKADLKKELKKNKSGFFLAYENSLDHPVGYLRVSEILKLLHEDSPFDLKENLKKPLFFPENITLLPMLEGLFNSGEAIAFLIDEYGGIVGVICIDPLLKEFFQDIVATFSLKHQITKINKNTWEVDGALPINDFMEIFSVDISTEVKRLGYHTLAGFCLFQLQKIPREGDQFTYQRFTFKILRMFQQRILKVLITEAPVKIW